MKDQSYSSKLFGHDKYFNDLIKLYKINKFPKSLMLSGNKGIGKFTLVKHFLNYFLDKNNYYLEKKEIMRSSNFSNFFFNETLPNIVYLNASEAKVKIDNIRILKDKINKSTINSLSRFVILDDIELFNLNSLNALLKIIEEPTKLNYFIFINNQKKPILETIKSRCSEIKIFLNERERILIIESLINDKNLTPVIDYKKNKISPGKFINFNNICLDQEINPQEISINDINNLFLLYNKEKKIIYIDLAKYLIEEFFSSKQRFNEKQFNDLIKIKIKIFKLINDYIIFNINQKSLLNTITEDIKNAS